MKQDHLTPRLEQAWSIVSSLTVPMSLVDPQGRVVGSNPAMMELTGFAADESIDFPPPAEEARITRKDGAIRCVKLATHPLAPTGELAGYRIIEAVDVTALREMETALRGSEDRFRAMVQESSDVVAVYTADACFTYVSPSAQRLLGYDPAALLGTSAFDLVHPEDQEAVRQAFGRTVMNVQRSSTHMFRIRHADGSWRNFETLARNLIDHPQIRGIVVTHRDVTGRIQGEAQVTQLREQLLQSQKMEAIGRLAGGIAHDFNNLLTSIIGYADLVLRGPRVDGETGEAVREIAAAAYRAADLTRRLLTFSRKQVLQSKVVDLNELILNLEKMLKRMIGEDIRLESRLSPSLGRVRADPMRLEQVIINLAVNARDAMPNGGTLRIDTEKVTVGPGSVVTPADVPPGEYAMVVVSDTGHGMDDEIKAHLFEPFFTTKAPGKGTGLGLATVYGTVRQSGGQVEVSSAPGRGTSFRIFLPVVQEERNVEPGGENACMDRRGSETILVVEDEESLLRMMVQSLRSCGYTTLHASSAAAAIEILEKGGHGTIALLLTDIVMPSVGGPELAREVRKRLADVKVLFISGYPAGEITAEQLQEEGDGFLSKPFSLKDLAAKVRDVLDAE
jgi:two-component system, cell cycle sensor histidine kinase and response regulator CckA